MERKIKKRCQEPERALRVAIRLIADLAAGPQLVGAVVPVRGVVTGAAASGPDPDRSQAVPTAQSPDSAASIPRGHPSRLWHLPRGSQPAFHVQSWVSPRRPSVPAANRKIDRKSTRLNSSHT